MFYTSRLPAKLYKYLPENAAEAFFKNPEVRFTLGNRLNDPFDLAPVGSYADHYGAIGVFCLSSTPTSMPMWAHYGDLGRGVVLEFRTDASFFDEYAPAQVKYKKKRPTVQNPIDALRVKSSEWAYEQEWRCFAELPRGGCKKFCVNGQMAGNCCTSKEMKKNDRNERTDRQPAG
jgi:hypothetical protein